jgi:hypothetical protein
MQLMDRKMAAASVEMTFLTQAREKAGADQCVVTNKKTATAQAKAYRLDRSSGTGR